MATYQMIELMPRHEWNKEDDSVRWGPRREDDPPEDALHSIFQHMISAEEMKLLPLGVIEHCAVDEIDLSVYKPIAAHHDALIHAVRVAFNNHRPIVFSPDLIYGYLVKGIAIHINTYPEELRSLYVNFDGKQQLEYRNDSFRMGRKENDWSLMFQYFASELKAKTKGNSVVQDGLRFSTTSRIAEAHRHVLTMESMKSYFDYKFVTLCGMSCIILEGQEEDWKLLRDTVTAQLKEINDFCAANPRAEKATLKWWSPAVEVVLDHFLATFTGRSRGEEPSEDRKLWWRTIYKYNHVFGSGGGATVTGWINALYPYLRRGVRNPWVLHCTPFIKDNAAVRKHFESYFDTPASESGGKCSYAVDPSDFPSYQASVPYVWNFHGTYHNMNILVGYTVLGQVSIEGALYPKGTLKLFPSWVIYHKDKINDIF